MFRSLRRFYRFITLLALWLLAASGTQAQAPAWQSLLVLAGSYGSATAMATDAAGNIYLAGTFNGTLTLGSTTLTATGAADIFVAKWNPTTNRFVWAKRAGGAHTDAASAIAVSGNNLYVAGYFESTPATFGTSSISNAQPPTVPFYARRDGFVAKLTDTGTDANFVWAQPVGGPGHDWVHAIVAAGNSVYLAGEFGIPSATFGTITVTNGGSSSTYNTDLFVAKLTDLGASGSFNWVQRGGGPLEDVAMGLALAGNSLYVCGSFQTAASVGPFTLSGTYTTAFLAKITDAGSSSTISWATALGGPAMSSAEAVTVGGSSIYVGGEFSGTTSFGGSTLVSAGFEDVYVASLTDLGGTARINWAQRGGGGSIDVVYALAADADNVYMTGGCLSPTSDFGPNTFTNLNPASSLSSSNPDLFLSRLTSAGSFVWTQQAGGAGADHGVALQVRGPALYVAGAATMPATFGSFTVTGSNLYLPFVASIGIGPLATAGSTKQPAQVLYPNPARDVTTVLLPAATSVARATLTLTDALGRVVRNHSVALTTASISYPLHLQGLPTGFYSVRVQVGTTVSVAKLIVE